MGNVKEYEKPVTGIMYSFPLKMQRYQELDLKGGSVFQN